MAEMDQNANKKSKWSLLLLNVLFLAIGACGGPMVMRLYFLHGGNRLWLTSWLETGGWPVTFIPLVITYFKRRRKDGSAAKLYFMGGPVFVATAVIGVLTGLDDYLYAYGVDRLPVSTVSLTSPPTWLSRRFSRLFWEREWELIVGAGVLALHSSSDRPKGESSKEYFVGFFMTLAAAILYGFVLPLVELTYKKAKQAITYTLVLEIQLVMCFFATLFCTIGMVINNDFQVIPREARDFGLGETTYYVVLVCSGIVWQGFFLGAIGVIFAGSSLLCAVIIATLLPVTEILAVIFYKEKFTAEKGVCLVLSLWGFVSYFYGELKHSKEKSETQTPETEMPQAISVITSP